jgi:hypothetical protein
MGLEAMNEDHFCPEMAGETYAQTAGFGRGEVDRYENFSDHDSIERSVRD